MAEFFVRRPIVAMVIAIIIVIVGLVSLGALPVAQYPEITPPEVQVSASYTGANAEVVEQSVATPIEQKVNGVENMLYMKSVNANDGTMRLTVAFEVGSDLDMSNVLVQNRVSEAQASVPEEVKRLGITVKKQLSFPLMLVSIYSPEPDLRSELSLQLSDHQRAGRGGPDPRRRPGPGARRQRVRHAGLGEAGSAGQAQSHRARTSPGPSRSRT